MCGSGKIANFDTVVAGKALKFGFALDLFISLQLLMTRYIAFFLIFVAGAVGRAAEIHVAEPGGLPAVAHDPEGETALTVTGNINAADLFFIARNMPELTELDLSGAVIEAYRGKKIEGRTSFPTNMIPQHLMIGHKLRSLALPASAGLTVGAAAFAGNPLESLTIPATVAEVGDGAFAGCGELRTLTVGARQIGAGAFAACPALESVTVAGDGTRLGDAAFAGDASLATVTGSERVSAVGTGAFRGCSALGAFDFGPGLEVVGERAFSRSGLRSVDLSGAAALDSVGAWAFAEAPALTSVRLGSAASVGEGIVFMCPALESLTLSAATDHMPAYACVHDRALIASDIIPDGTRIIGAHALHGLSAVTELTIPASVTRIDERAMAGMTGLQTVTVASATPASLGEAVWEGVDQSSVTLEVPRGASADYEAAAQWQDFRVNDAAAIDELTAGATVPRVRGRFAGHELQIEAIDADMARIAIHDPAGVLLLALEPYDRNVSVDTDGLATRVYIIAVTLTDGNTVTLKLARH